MMSAKSLGTIHHLYDLENGIPEDPTPFTTYARLKESGAVSYLQDLDQAAEDEECKEIGKQSPFVGVFENLEMLATDRKGKVHKIGAMSRGVILGERLRKIEKNPTLAHLCNINNSKVYYNIPEDEFWLEVYQPIWINRKRTLKKVSSIKLESHDIETLEAFCVAYRRGFHNPTPKQMWIGKPLRQKTAKICRAFNEHGRTLEKLSRKNHCFG